MALDTLCISLTANAIYTESLLSHLQYDMRFKVRQDVYCTTS